MDRSHRDAFLRAIAETPDDDAPRLIFADWLDDNGEPERAEFIRLQCREARLGPGDPRAGDLHSRAEEILAAHKPAWVPPPAQRQGVYTIFRRGLLDYLGGDDMTDEDLHALAGNLELSRLSVGGEGVTGAGLAHLLSLPRLERLYVSGNGVSDATLQFLSRHPGLRMLAGTAVPGTLTDEGLRHLHVMHRLLAVGFFDEESREIFSQEAMAEWHELRSSRWRVLPPAERRRDALYFFDHFSDSPQRREGDKVKRIYLQQCSFSDADVEFVTAVPEVEEIELYQTRLTGSGLHHLAGLAHLRSLKLNECDAVDDVSGIEGLTRLEEFHVSRYSALTDETAAPVETLTGLRSLKLAGAALTEATLRRLEKLPRLESLELFEFAPITSSGMRALAGLKHFSSLSFWGQARISRDGFEVLATLRGLESLRAIHGFQPELTRQSLRLLGDLTNLKVLDLGSYWHTSVSANALEELRGLTNLEWLALPADSHLTPAAARRISKWFPQATVAAGQQILSTASDPVFARRAIDEAASIELPEGWDVVNWATVDDSDEPAFQGIVQERGFRHAGITPAGHQMVRLYVARRTLPPGSDLRARHVRTANSLSFHSAEPSEPLPPVSETPGADEAHSWRYTSYAGMFAHRDFVWRRGRRCYALYCMAPKSRIEAFEPHLRRMAASFQFEEAGGGT